MRYNVLMSDDLMMKLSKFQSSRRFRLAPSQFQDPRNWPGATRAAASLQRVAARSLWQDGVA